MSHEYKARIEGKLGGPNFLRGQYSREQTWTFDGGVKVPVVGAITKPGGEVMQLKALALERQ